MVEPINLREFRKRKHRQQKEPKAEENRQASGLSKTAKDTINKMRSLEQKRLDGKKLDLEE